MEYPKTQWFKNCPICGTVKYFKNKKTLTESLKYNLPCKTCSHVGKNTWMKGKPLSKKTKDKLSQVMKGKNTWSADRNTSNETKLKLSVAAKGKIRSEEYRKNIRIAKLKRLKELGIPQCQDSGAKDFFEKINKQYNVNFQPKTFMEIGYVADGYDESKHIWIEYDTPYHLGITQKQKDIVRENRILEYFKQKGNPLKKFIRIQVNKKGDISTPLNPEDIY